MYIKSINGFFDDFSSFTMIMICLRYSIFLLPIIIFYMLFTGITEGVIYGRQGQGIIASVDDDDPSSFYMLLTLFAFLFIFTFYIVVKEFFYADLPNSNKIKRLSKNMDKSVSAKRRRRKKRKKRK